jgi:hypothetical protein
LSGYARKVASCKQDGTMELLEGKAPLSFQGKLFLAEKAWRATTDFMLSIHSLVFLLLSWNLMARSNNISGLMFVHMSMSMDALVVNIPCQKGFYCNFLYFHNLL